MQLLQDHSEFDIALRVLGTSAMAVTHLINDKKYESAVKMIG